ncbi:hypothetical protein M6B38_258535 [Iris pallida]|uniref:Uncharacterized protein n=1 Tax=Iris pallida TaxID=29817 RepID=A0AAX6IFW0_IRIPA|nr:hypothetical protein M6B38_258535 [Iris pallida]
MVSSFKTDKQHRFYYHFFPANILFSSFLVIYNHHDYINFLSRI